MNSLTMLTVATMTLVLSCNQTSKKEVRGARQNLEDAKHELNDVINSENNAAFTKTSADWKKFKTESDNAMAKLDQDLTKLDENLAKMNTKDKQVLDSDYRQAKSGIMALKDRLNKKNGSFNHDLRTYGDQAIQENVAFRKSFKVDLAKVELSVRKMIRDDQK